MFEEPDFVLLMQMHRSGSSTLLFKDLDLGLIARALHPLEGPPRSTRAVHDYVDFSETNSNLYKVPYPPDCFIRSIPSRIPPVVFAILDHSSFISGINLDV